MVAADVKTGLRYAFAPQNGSGDWVCVDEAFSGLSAGGGIDLLAVGCWVTSSHRALDDAALIINQRARRIRPTYPYVACEIKVSRADFKRELVKWPTKASHALRRCHYYLFATPTGLLHEHEISRSEADDRGLWLPEDAGLIEIGGDHTWNVRKPAPLLSEPEPLSRLEVAELLRRVINKPESTTTPEPPNGEGA